MSMTDIGKIKKREDRLANRARALEALFSASSVLGSESGREYSALYKTLKSEMPQYTVMQKWRAKQLTDSMWLAMRTLRLHAGAIEGARVEALMKLLMPYYENFLDEEKRTEIAIDYFTRGGEPQKKAIQIVERLGITGDMIDAYALELQSPTVMALDKMRARCEHSIDQAEKKLMDSTRSKKVNKEDRMSDNSVQLSGKPPAIEATLSRMKD